MSITLETANNMLQAWLNAEMAIATGQSYSMGSRSLTRANLSEVRKSVEYWESKVNTLSGKITKRRVMGGLGICNNEQISSCCWCIMGVTTYLR